ncbi:MAG TPA: hypothetical protein PLP01_08100 [Phycisphaerae bacterium]|nr:hypothetical protein [Phycisphaerae bacterium]
MRISENRQLVEVLYILGAGASYASSLPSSGVGPFTTPLDADFTARIGSLKVDRPEWVEATRKHCLNSWKDHRSFESSGLETAVLRQLGHLEFLRAIHPRRARENPTAGEWLLDIAHLISFVLNPCRQNTQKLFDRFADLAFPQGADYADCRNRVITFNYDSLLDDVLLKRFTPQHLYFYKIKGRSAAGEHVDRVLAPLYLKLHGSINWRCSADDFRHVLRNANPANQNLVDLGEIRFDDGEIPRPQDDDCPLIVPPLPTKPISTVSIFQYLWTRAYEYLYTAQKLVICGYSLPPADQMAVSMFSNFHNRDLQEVTIIDPSAAVLTRWRDLLRRSSVKVGNWRYCETFKEYLEGA